LAVGEKCINHAAFTTSKSVAFAGLQAFQKTGTLFFTQRAENGALFAASTPTWPHHTDTRGLSTLLRSERVDVLMQEVDGGVEAVALDGIKQCASTAFAVLLRSLEGIVRFDDAFDHRHGEGDTGHLRNFTQPLFPLRTRSTGPVVD
jgi:hypothetical protein